MQSKLKVDISQANQSKLTIPKSDYLSLQQEIKKVKYPTYAISQAQNLIDKIATFKNQKVKTKLIQQLSQLNSYRKVRGDGNCFFRALDFAYISSITIPSFDNCFQMINQVNLACCFSQSIPKQFQKFYDHKFLLYILQHYWQPIYHKCLKQSKNINKKALLKLFDQNPYLDFILILYFRAVCLKALYRYHTQFSNFIVGGQQTSIRTYSQQTQGITINLCSKILKITIFVYQVRKQQVHSYHYDASKIRRDVPFIYLLFYQNHYDIIQFNQNIQAQKSGLRKKQTYYEQVNEKLSMGKCIQCGIEGYIYDISSLCMKCHEHSLTSLNNFTKQHLVKGKCAQCLYTKDDISISFGLCRKCIQIQNQVEQRRMTQTQKKKKLKRCYSCNGNDEINQQTGLCLNCLHCQKEAMNKLQFSKKQLPQSQSALRQNGQKQNIIQNSQNYTENICLSCKTKCKVRLDNSLCDQCFSIKSKLNIINPSRVERQPEERSRIQRHCEKCHTRIDPQTNGNLCRSCLVSAQSYHSYTCKYCNRMQINGLADGYCQACKARRG